MQTRREEMDSSCRRSSEPTGTVQLSVVLGPFLNLVKF